MDGFEKSAKTTRTRAQTAAEAAAEVMHQGSKIGCVLPAVRELLPERSEGDKRAGSHNGICEFHFHSLTLFLLQDLEKI